MHLLTFKKLCTTFDTCGHRNNLLSLYPNSSEDMTIGFLISEKKVNLWLLCKCLHLTPGFILCLQHWLIARGIHDTITEALLVSISFTTKGTFNW